MIVTNGIEWSVFCAVQQFRIPTSTLSEKLDALLQWTEELNSNSSSNSESEQCQYCSIVSIEREAMLCIFYWECNTVEGVQRMHQKFAQEMFNLELIEQTIIDVQMYKLFAHALRRKLKRFFWNFFVHQIFNFLSVVFYCRIIFYKWEISFFIRNN